MTVSKIHSLSAIKSETSIIVYIFFNISKCLRHSFTEKLSYWYRYSTYSVKVGMCIAYTLRQTSCAYSVGENYYWSMCQGPKWPCCPHGHGHCWNVSHLMYVRQSVGLQLVELTLMLVLDCQWLSLIEDEKNIQVYLTSIF